MVWFPGKTFELEVTMDSNEHVTFYKLVIVTIVMEQDPYMTERFMPT